MAFRRTSALLSGNSGRISFGVLGLGERTALVNSSNGRLTALTALDFEAMAEISELQLATPTEAARSTASACSPASTPMPSARFCGSPARQVRGPALRPAAVASPKPSQRPIISAI
jgi:hypothetical protein